MLSERMRSWDTMEFYSVRKIVDAWADEVAALERRVEGLEREVCTCPWPEDAAKTRHLLSCRLMQMEHEVYRAEEEA